MDSQLATHISKIRQLKQILEQLYTALEDIEPALLKFEVLLDNERAVRERPQENPQETPQETPQEARRGSELLSIPDVCRELGMGRSWVYRHLKSGHIPSVKLGRNIRVKREDLDKYLEEQRYQPTELDSLEADGHK